MDWSSESPPASNQSVLTEPPEITLRHQTFSYFDRDALLRCVEKLLIDPTARGTITQLIEAATIRTWFGKAVESSDRWCSPSQIQNYEPSRKPSDELVTVADPIQTPVGVALEDLLDLHKLYNLLPTVEFEQELAALTYGWQVSLGVIYSLTAVTSFLLNAITVIVLLNCQRSELRRYLINLSVSDLLMSCFSIPFNYTEYLLGSWIFPGFLCPVNRFVVTLSVFVSIATMTVIGINRHSAIMNPLKKRKPTKIRHWRVREMHVILGIWLLGIAISLPEYLMFSAEPFCYNQRLYFECRQLWPESISNSYTIFIYVSTFVVPLSLLSFLYIRIGLKLWHHKTPGNEDANRDSTMQMQRTKVFKMLLVVMIVFIVSWLPIQTFSIVDLLMVDLRKSIPKGTITYNLVLTTYFVCHWLSMAHSCLNPLIYGFMSKKFRRDLQSYICGSSGFNKADCTNMENRSVGGGGGGGGANMRVTSRRSPNLRSSVRATECNQRQTPEATCGRQLEMQTAGEQGETRRAEPIKQQDKTDPLASNEWRRASDQSEQVANNGGCTPCASRRASSNQGSQAGRTRAKPAKRRASDETFVVVEFHDRRDKYTSRLKSCHDLTLSSLKPQDAKLATLSARLGCGEAVAQTLHEVDEEKELDETDEYEDEDEDEDDAGDNEGAGGDGTSGRAHNGQDVEQCKVAIRQSEHNFGLFEPNANNSTANKINGSIARTDSRSASSPAASTSPSSSASSPSSPQPQPPSRHWPKTDV